MDSVASAVAIRELLQQIFQYCDSKDNFHNALVSKKWSDEALVPLWRRLQSVKPLLSLLSPLLVRVDGKYDFERSPRASDWAIFRKYSCLVHHISEPIGIPPRYSESVFLDIAASRPLCDLLPNLCSLRIPSHMTRVIPLLVHEGLADLTVNILTNAAELEGQRSIMTFLPVRCPNLTRLEFYVSGSNAYIDIGLAALLKALPCLTEIDLTPQLLTREAICALAHLPRLEHLKSTWEFPFEREGRTHSMILPPQAHNGFTSIKTLALSHSFEDVASLLRASQAKGLRHLSIDPDGWQSPDEYLRVLEAASTGCPSLETLSMVEWDLRETEIASPHRSIASWKLFKPLLRLPHLTSLSFMDLRLDVDALLNIAKALPSLRRLALQCTSSIDHPPTFPLSILPTLGSLCRQLKFLCLQVDTSLPTLALTPIRASTAPLECLDELDVATSSLDSPAPEVAAYLSSLLREDCRLSRLLDTSLNDGGPKYDSWKPVIDFLPVIIRIRKLEKEAAAAAASR